jgi:drug/metabolite transporter (DMT)-like permease
MKTTGTLFLVAILLMCSSLAYAQQDSTIYKIKLEKYKSWNKTGSILTYGGAALLVVGAALTIGGFHLDNTREVDGNEDSYIISGYVCMGAGLVSLIPGIIYKSIGKSKTREYQMRLDGLKSGIYYGPNQVGLKLAFKF